MKDQIVRLLGQKDYVPASVPELLRLLRLPPNCQQVLQGALCDPNIVAAEVTRL